MQQNKSLFFIILLIISLASIVVRYISLPSSYTLPQLFFFNADALYLPTLFADIFSKSGDIKDWFLTPAPYFFPDYPVFLIAYWLGADAYTQIVVFALLQTILTFAALFFLIKKSEITNALLIAVTALIVLIWLALSPIEEFIYLLISAHHYGIFLSTIIFVVVLFKINKQDNKIKEKIVFYSALAIFAFGSTLSDNLFLVQVIVPLFAISILTSIKDRDYSIKTKIPLIMVVFFSVLGSIAYGFTVANQTRYSAIIGVDHIFINLQSIYKLMYTAIIHKPILGVFFICYMGIVLSVLVSLIKNKTNIASKLDWIVVFSFLSICSTLSVVLVVTNLSITSRYLIPVFFWPIIIVLIFFSHHFTRYFIPIAACTSLLLTVFLSWDSYLLLEKNGVNGQYYPIEIACIDDVLEQENLTNGIAYYWEAKQLQKLSRLDLEIAQHFENLGEMHWITSKKYFKDSYDFAVVSGQDPLHKAFSEALVALNGAPKFVKNCGGKSVYVYGKNKLITH